jgi:hypothetical protein
MFKKTPKIKYRGVSEMFKPPKKSHKLRNLLGFLGTALVVSGVVGAAKKNDTP